MLNEIVKNIGRFVILVLFQGIILNDASLMDGMAIPYLYVIIILLLPLETPRWLELIIGLIVGLSVDMFTNTLGIHASATVLLAFMRPVLLKWIAPRDGYEFGVKPTIADLGLSWYLKYAGVLILIHHVWLFFIEVYSFTGFFHTLLRALVSAAFTLVLAILAQYLVSTRRSSTII